MSLELGNHGLAHCENGSVEVPFSHRVLVYSTLTESGRLNGVETARALFLFVPKGFRFNEVLVRTNSLRLYDSTQSHPIPRYRMIQDANWPD
jgi:hypothetical protein